MRGIRKSFPGVVAVDGVDLDVDVGEIHALAGENGAGKSTLAAIAFGELRADAGTVEARGRVGLVHQHFELVGRLTVWQNVVLGREPRRGWSVDRDAARRRVLELSQQTNLEVDPDAFVDELPIGMQQRVELLRELARSPTILVLDEPTSALAPAEIDALFAAVARLAREGAAILVVTHKLQEALAFSHRISVMRRGKVVASMETSRTNADEIARAMVGGDLPKVAGRTRTELQPCLHVSALEAGGAGGVNGVNLEVRGGEIVGVAGVEGNGQTALADAIMGLVPFRGTVSLPARGSIGVIPQDRHREGLVLNFSVAENAVLGRQHSADLRRGYLLDVAREREDARAIVERFDVRPASIDVRARTLSGGNQQKLVVGRALIGAPRFILAYNPTRGIDVGAAALVQSRLVEARNAGAAILLVSFDLDEVLMLADRIAVLSRGKVAGTFERPNVDRAQIGRLMAGAG